MADVTVREYARLTTDLEYASLDVGIIPSSAFFWLLERSQETWLGPRILAVDGPRSLKIGSYVGVIETPCGTRIEVLPKTAVAEDLATSRRLLTRMISRILRVTPKPTGFAHIDAFEVPLPEWLIGTFLRAATDLVKIGLRQSYGTAQSTEPFLRGKFLSQRQMRQPPGRGHLFDIEYDVFTFDRAENRLIKSTIEHVIRRTKSAENWRLARELSVLFADIPCSAQSEKDFMAWQSTRLTANYNDIRTWCELILREQVPFAISGLKYGLSMLFPMERLFEEFVAVSLRKQIPREFNLATQVVDHHFCTYQGVKQLPLRPDMVISRGSTKWILDTKWKILGGNYAKLSDVDETDMYQLFAYGKRYLGHSGEMYLIYPRTSSFREPVGPVLLPDDLSLFLAPFDLEEETAKLHFLSL